MNSLKLKKELSEELVGKSDFMDEDGVKALADTFNVSEEEALGVLKECGNDIRTAMKVLRMKDKE